MKRENKGRTIPAVAKSTALSLVLSVTLAASGVPLAAAEEAGDIAEPGRVISAGQPESVPVGPQGTAPTLPGQIAGEAPLSKDGAKATFGIVVFEGLEYTVNPDGSTVALTGFSDDVENDVVVPSEIASGEDTYLVTQANISGGGAFSAK